MRNSVQLYTDELTFTRSGLENDLYAFYELLEQLKYKFSQKWGLKQIYLMKKNLSSEMMFFSFLQNVVTSPKTVAGLHENNIR